MFKKIKKLVNKNKTASLALASITISLTIGLSIPSAINPSVNQVCFDWDPNCTQTRSTKKKAQKAAKIRQTTTQQENPPAPPPFLDEDEHDINPANPTTSTTQRSDGCKEGVTRCSPNKTKQFCAPLPDNKGTQWIDIGGSCNPSQPKYTSPNIIIDSSDNQKADDNDNYVNIPGYCDPNQTGKEQCSSDKVCAQVTNQLWMCQDKNQTSAKPCSKPQSEAGPNAKSTQQAYYSHNFTLNTLDECQVKAGVPTGWIVKKQVCQDGQWIDVEVVAPENGVGNNQCPAIFNCQDYPEYCPEEQSQQKETPTNQVSRFLNFVKNLFSF